MERSGPGVVVVSHLEMYSREMNQVEKQLWRKLEGQTRPAIIAAPSPFNSITHSVPPAAVLHAVLTTRPAESQKWAVSDEQDGVVVRVKDIPGLPARIRVEAVIDALPREVVSAGAARCCCIGWSLLWLLHWPL